MSRTFDPVTPGTLVEQDGSSYPRLIALVRRLLEPDGCPWDREQDFASLRRYVQEEAAEVVDALDRDDRDGLRHELGDLLYQVAFLGELARAQGDFGPDDVVAAIVAKLIRRHPHVFGDDAADDARAVRRQWERIKTQERQEQGGAAAPLLGSVPPALSALAHAQRIGEKVAAVGFDWPDVAGARAKVTEELGELDAAIAALEGSSAVAESERARLRDRTEAELGDVLFALTNLARHLGLETDAALRRTTRKFVERFAHVERRVRAERGGWPTEGPPLPLTELDGYWEEAKAAERSAAAMSKAEPPPRAGSDRGRMA